MPGMLPRVSERVREVLGELDHPCSACGAGFLVAVQARGAMRLRDRFRTDPDRRGTRYETCLGCGTTVRVSTVNPRRASGGDHLGRGHVAL